MSKLDELIQLIEINEENCAKIKQYEDEIFEMFYKLADGFVFETLNSRIGRIKDGDENVFLTIDFEEGKVLSFEINAIGEIKNIIEKNIKRKYDKNHEELIQLTKFKKNLKWEN